MELEDLLALMNRMEELVEQADNQRCDYDRYDEGYADAMYDAIDIVRELVSAA